MLTRIGSASRLLWANRGRVSVRPVPDQNIAYSTEESSTYLVPSVCEFSGHYVGEAPIWSPRRWKSCRKTTRNWRTMTRRMIQQIENRVKRSQCWNPRTAQNSEESEAKLIGGFRFSGHSPLFMSNKIVLGIHKYDPSSGNRCHKRHCATPGQGKSKSIRRSGHPSLLNHRKKLYHAHEILKSTFFISSTYLYYFSKL